MPEPEPMPEPVPMDMDTSPLIGVWTADNEFHTIEFTATTFIDRVSGLTCDYTDNGNSITLSNCMGFEGAENRNGATVEYTIDGDTLTLDGTAYTRQNSDVPEPTVPGTMDAPSLEAGNAQLTVNWTPPEETGDSEITAYELRHSDDGGSSWSEDITTADAPALRADITGLINGTTYVVQVRARNSAGAGNWSESSAEATPIGVSLAPNGLMLAVSMQTITATWTAPTDTGDSPIIRYELQHHEVGASEWEATVSIPVNADPNHTYTHPITELTNGIEYDVRVYAVNTEGNGNPATGTATPIGPPAMPNAPTLTVGDTQLTATWTAPNNGGSPITGYDVQYSSDSGSTWTPASGNPISGTSYTIPNLTNDGTSYDVQVRARNTLGDSDWSLSATRTLLPLAARVPFGTSTTSVILSADIDDAAANAENPSVTVAGVTSGTSVTPPTVDSSTGVITVTATTTAGTYNVSVIDGTDENTRVTEKFYVTVRPQDEDNKYADDAGSDAAEILADLKLKVNTGISTWGNTADLNYIITTAVTKMVDIFNFSEFNGDISRWDVSSVTNMNQMFNAASEFNGDISEWDVSKVTNMSYMIAGATSFNRDISGWDVRSVTSMFGMFTSATSFNHDISGWDVSKVTNMSYMFSGATSFNRDISRWDVSKVTNMSYMFGGASAFNVDLNDWAVDADDNNLTTGSWNNGRYTGTKTSMFAGSGLDSGDTTDPETTVTQPNYPSWYW